MLFDPFKLLLILYASRPADSFIVLWNNTQATGMGKYVQQEFWNCTIKLLHETELLCKQVFSLNDHGANSMKSVMP